MWRATVKAGGGLTIGSDPAAEVREAKLKVGAFGSLVFMSTNWFLSPPTHAIVAKVEIRILGG